MDENDFKNLDGAEPLKYSLEKNRRIFKKSLIVFVFIFFVLGAFFLGRDMGKNSALVEKQKEINIPLSRSVVENSLPPENLNVDFSLFWKVWEIVKEKHIGKADLNAQELVYGAIKGMLKATGDPYTSFFDPKESKSFSEDLEGSFEGIGAELGIKDNILTVIAPLEDSPAQRAGLRAGDKILKVGDQIVADMTIDEAVDIIRGKSGTEVKLTILQTGAEETKEVTIVRGKIEIKSVKLEFKENDIAYVKLTKFGETTSEEFDQTVNQIVSKNAKGIILDLRNNPGGLLDQSVEIASRMIPRGKVVVTEEDSAGKKESLRTIGGDRLSALPMAVLINEGSASASEILAGALRDNQGIALIGKKSFGKGSVQELKTLPGGSSVKITVAKWLTPNGDYIMDKGINPDVEVDLTLDDFNNNRDPQLDKAMEVIREKVRTTD
ncbi:MAG: hypothetical protein A2288_01285 [Candidatus Moranbacteria bacterium RIFOXYA12_FULL_44_15]|nr:MAG: hypothetical protein A2288_01285 [Candidatus Moranbacteria bacterium RIFOXYA12_FULL_44_15]OGI36195.1 MAG: hypothetical protein A2259_03115 [Candidatus Moranbacteria bacterium RIFOXYA2_FULL_43_15]